MTLAEMARKALQKIADDHANSPEFSDLLRRSREHDAYYAAIRARIAAREAGVTPRNSTELH